MYYMHLYGKIRKSNILLYMVFDIMLTRTKFYIVYLHYYV